MNKFLFVFSMLLLSACTSKQVIQSVSNNDWKALGNYDGSNGFIEKSEQALNKLNQEYGSEALDLTAYLTSYQLALDEYCKPNNAYILGVMGKPYFGVCEQYPNGWSFREDWVSGRHSQAGSL